MILQLAQHTRGIELLDGADDLDEGRREYYGNVLHSEPDEVTKDLAIQYERRFVDGAKTDLLDALNTPEAGGNRFNFKKRRFEESKKKLDDLTNELGISLRQESPEEVSV